MRFLASLFLAGSVLMAGGDAPSLRPDLDRSVAGVKTMLDDARKTTSSFKKEQDKRMAEIGLLNAATQELEGILALYKDVGKAMDQVERAKDADRAERRKDLATCLGRAAEAEAGLVGALGGEEGWPPAIKDYCRRTVDGLKGAKALADGMLAAVAQP